jgi:hypothetical protein
MPKLLEKGLAQQRTDERQKVAQEYYYKHHTVLEDIYQALRPTNTLAKCYINCPCGTKGVAYLKLKQHICCKKHRKVLGDEPLVSHFL